MINLGIGAFCTNSAVLPTTAAAFASSSTGIGAACGTTPFTSSFMGIGKPTGSTPYHISLMSPACGVIPFDSSNTVMNLGLGSHIHISSLNQGGPSLNNADILPNNQDNIYLGQNLYSASDNVKAPCQNHGQSEPSNN
ncbi:unnamed protein product [Brachionus calyciflorus]|uniref:Uncharacterized protein n=1 Tax=Brachionus calyciflorus TaxID=104777 RepID=A0A814L8I0_9BILA|nr:unnamed protein product [Brachionus calyciflorus]